MPSGTTLILAAVIPVYLGGILFAWILRMITPMGRLASGAVGVTVMALIAMATFHYGSQFEPTEGIPPKLATSWIFPVAIYGLGGIFAFGLVYLGEARRTAKLKKKTAR